LRSSDLNFSDLKFHFSTLELCELPSVETVGLSCRNLFGLEEFQPGVGKRAEWRLRLCNGVEDKNISLDIQLEKEGAIHLGPPL
jgi:hypothetical protein